jgi:membrane glycosyltransferase
MLQQVARRQDAVEGISMPDQVLFKPFTDSSALNLMNRASSLAARFIVFGLPLVFSLLVGSILVLSFQSDGQLEASECVLIVLMALLCCWEAIPSTNAIIGPYVSPKSLQAKSSSPLTIAILATIRDEAAHDVIRMKVDLLRALQNQSRHAFSLHVLSDSSSLSQMEHEMHLVRMARPLPVFYRHRIVNTDFKSGNIRNWIETGGAAYDAFITLDADSEIDYNTALTLADALSSDSACGLIQTLPSVQRGKTIWQDMQAIASQLYGGLQGRGLSKWMGDEANYYGHNAIIRTKAFAASGGLPHLKSPGLWNGTILSHDFVEAALLRRAGWAVRLMPVESGSFEQAPDDVIAHLKRDARWCLGNFQHSRILCAAGLHMLSRFHLLSGIFTYLSSALWMATLVLWGTLDATQTGVGGRLAMASVLLIAINLLLPRILGVVHAMASARARRWTVLTDTLKETLFSSFVAPSLMVQRVMIIGRVLSNQSVTWAPQDKASRGFIDYFLFHVVEVLVGLGLLASIERGFLTSWFLPLAICLAVTPILSWFSARPRRNTTHENLNDKTPL